MRDELPSAKTGCSLVLFLANSDVSHGQTRFLDLSNQVRTPSNAMLQKLSFNTTSAYVMNTTALCDKASQRENTKRFDPTAESGKRSAFIIGSKQMTQQPGTRPK